jgi:small subunit ribosomal protein S4
VVFRLGFAPSRATARQMVLHNHFRVNGDKVNVPSSLVSQGDVVEVREKSKNLAAIHNALKSVKDVPAWLSLDKVKMAGTVIRVPARIEMPSDVQEQLVVELYSK